MKTIIYYFSKTGHSKNYAESLASRCNCESFNYKSMKYRHMKDYDTIVFVSPVYGNKIRKVDKFLKLYKKIKFDDSLEFLFPDVAKKLWRWLKKGADWPLLQ